MITKQKNLNLIQYQQMLGIEKLFISITANKVKGVRAALCTDCFCAQATREHNDANILTMGQRVVGPGLALDIVKTFLTSKFEGGRHIKRIEKITEIEQKYSK